MAGGGYEGVKRVLDVVVAGGALVLLLPVLALAALAVRLSIGRPVLFRQVRPGLGGRPFTLYKLRTMRDTVGPDGQPLPDAQRLTRTGRVIRALSLDELPGLVNVLRGDMSLVGPRPLLMEYLPLYSPTQARRHEVRPGLTGWAQVNGRNRISWEERLRLDTWYVDNRSLALDMKILAITLVKVMGREGISQPGHSTSEKFNGSSDS